MDKFDWAFRTASAIYNLGWNSLSITEELSLQSSPEFRERVEELLRQMRNGETIRKPRKIKHIILDQPSWSYDRLLYTLSSEYDYIHIDFLCSSVPELSHFIISLEERSITYRCLNVPVSKWAEWKKRPEYKGD